MNFSVDGPVPPAPRRRRGPGMLVPVVVLAAAVGGILWFAGPRATGPTASQVAPARMLDIFDGTLVLDPESEITRGPADAISTVVTFFDFQCPHCEAVYQATLRRPDTRLVLLPTPLDPAMNGYVQDLPRPEFVHSLALARLFLALGQVDRVYALAFEAWAFGEGWPHTAEAGRTFAESLVEPRVLDAALADPAVDAALRRNIDAWGHARDAGTVTGLPVLVDVGSGRVVSGRNAVDRLDELWDGPVAGE